MDLSSAILHGMSLNGLCYWLSTATFFPAVTIIPQETGLPEMSFGVPCREASTGKACLFAQLHQVYPTRRVYPSSKVGSDCNRFTPLESLHADFFCIHRGRLGILDFSGSEEEISDAGSGSVAG